MNGELVALTLATLTAVEYLRDQHVSPGQKIGRLASITAGSLFAGWVIPPSANREVFTALFIFGATMVSGKYAGTAVDKLRLWWDRRKWVDQQNQKGM